MEHSQPAQPNNDSGSQILEWFWDKESVRIDAAPYTLTSDSAETAGRAIQKSSYDEETEHGFGHKANFKIESMCERPLIRNLFTIVRALVQVLRRERDKNAVLRLSRSAAEEYRLKSDNAFQGLEQDLRACEEKLTRVEREKEDSECKASKKYQTLHNKLGSSQRQTGAAKRKALRDLDGLNKKLKRSEQDFEVSQFTVSHHSQKLHEAQENAAALQSELTACKDALFRLQPASSLPDSYFVKAFETICQQIVTWIDGKVFAFEHAYSKGTTQIFSVGSDTEAMIFLESYPTAGEHLARFLIHRFLQIHLFSKNIYLLGLPEKTQMMLREAEQSMAGLEPPRDPSTITLWRSETLRALAATHRHQIFKKRQTGSINDSLFRQLGQVFPELFCHRNKSSFFEEVTSPAADLAVMMQGSTTEYSFVMNSSPNEKVRPAVAEDLKRLKLLDVKTAKHLKPDSVEVDDNGLIGNFILKLEPNLNCIDKHGREIVLFPATILIELSHPLRKPRNRKESLEQPVSKNRNRAATRRSAPIKPIVATSIKIEPE